MLSFCDHYSSYGACSQCIVPRTAWDLYSVRRVVACRHWRPPTLKHCFFRRSWSATRRCVSTPFFLPDVFHDFSGKQQTCLLACSFVRLCLCVVSRQVVSSWQGLSRCNSCMTLRSCWLPRSNSSGDSRRCILSTCICRWLLRAGSSCKRSTMLTLLE